MYIISKAAHNNSVQKKSKIKNQTQKQEELSYE